MMLIDMPLSAATAQKCKETIEQRQSETGYRYLLEVYLKEIEYHFIAHQDYERVFNSWLGCSRRKDKVFKYFEERFLKQFHE